MTLTAHRPNSSRSLTISDSDADSLPNSASLGGQYASNSEHPEFLDQPLYVASFSAADRETMKTKVRADYQARHWT